MTTNSDLMLTEIQRLFTAFPRGTNTERALAYVGALRTKAISAERLSIAVTHLIATWERDSPPPIAIVIKSCFGRASESPGEAEKRAQDAKVLRYYLERYSDADYYEFVRAFGKPASVELCQRMNVAPPDGVTFRQPTREWCATQRKAARDAAAAAFDRLRRNIAPPPPEPAKPAALDVGEVGDLFNPGAWDAGLGL